MPTVQCTCGGDVWYNAATAGSVVCPRCDRRVAVPPQVRRWNSNRSSAGSTDLRFPISLWLLIALAVTLTPAWLKGEMAYQEVAGELVATPIKPILRAMLSPWLPVALALLLSVRAGGANLSVWGCAALGAAVCWAGLDAGLPAELALTAAVVAGAAVGITVAGVCRYLRVPVGLIAAAGGIAAMVLSRVLEAALDPLTGERIDELGNGVSRLVMTLALYFLPLVAVAIAYRTIRARGQQRHAWRWLWLTLSLGGGLSAAAGYTMLMSSGEFRSSAWLFGDLRVLSSVVLCGGWVWRGRGGLGLACALLPLAMLVSTMWMDTVGVWLPGIRGTWPVLLLTVMAGASQFVMRGRGRRILRRLAGAVAAVGTLIMAAGAYWPVEPMALQLALLGGLMAFAGLIVGLYRLRALHRDRQTVDSPSA